MRVLHIYGGNLFGGVERLLVTLAERRAMTPEVEARFALCFHGRLWRELERAGVEVQGLGAVRASRPWQVARARRGLRRWLAAMPEGERPQAAICHAWWSYAVFGPACRQVGLKVGLWMHDCASGRGWLERWAGRQRPDFIFTWGETIAATAPRLFPGMTARPLAPPQTAIPALGDAERGEMRRKLETGECAVVILMASRLEPWKGHGLLLEALARLQESGWVAWIAGGPQRPHEEHYYIELQQQAERLRIAGRVRWLGQRDDVAALMGAADIFCQPNTTPEPFGMVFVEALAAGLPIVATGGGGASEVVSENAGVLTAPAAEEVARALAELIASPARRQQLAAGARERAADFEPGARMRALAAALHEVTA
ncbi:MAG TPA: glycosyltransferase [Terriglobales bacterium]|nr:glycosyltransferase [Terriglobales bacterium]